VLEATPVSIDSALQRAHKTVDERLPSQSQQQTLRQLGDKTLSQLVGRYIAAWERNDVDAVVSMLAADRAMTMPPLPTWYRGRDDVAAFLAGWPLQPGRRWRVVPVRANGQLAFAHYRWDEERRIFSAPRLVVITLAGDEIAVSDAEANHWSPALAADGNGKVYVAYDSYARGNYDVLVAELGMPGMGVRRRYELAATPRAEMRPSVVCDKDNRLWVAYEEGDEQWGKDYSTGEFRKIGFERNPGFALYIRRTVRVKCLEDGTLKGTAGAPEAAFGALAAVLAKLQEIRPGLQGEAAEAADKAAQSLKAPPAPEAPAEARRAWAENATAWLGRLLMAAPQAKAVVELGEKAVKALDWA
jgi:hypothetical protein